MSLAIPLFERRLLTSTTVIKQPRASYCTSYIMSRRCQPRIGTSLAAVKVALKCILALLLFVSVVSVLAHADGETLGNGEEVETFVSHKIRNVDIMVFAKSYCPYCRHTKELLQELVEQREKDGKTIPTVEILNLDELDDVDGPYIQMYLLQTTGQRTVPNIFIGSDHVGGDSDLTALVEDENGETMDLILNDVLDGKLFPEALKRKVAHQ
jgi:glutaredoxin 3